MSLNLNLTDDWKHQTVLSFSYVTKILTYFTARKRSLERLCFYTCLSFCPQGWGGVGGVGIPACIAGLQAHTRRGVVEGSGLGASPGPHKGGKLRGLAWGGGLQAHTQGGEVEGSGLGGLQAHTQGVSQHALRQTTPADGYCCGWYASYWNAFL